MKINSSLLSLALLAALASCKPDAFQPDLPANPSGEANQKSDKPTPNDEVISVFKKTKVSWSNTDYQEVDYDASLTPVRYTRQNLYAQSTNQVRKVIHDLIYSDKQLTRVNASNGTYVLYSYEGDQVSRTQEFSPAGKLLTTQTYLYSLDNRLHRIDATQAIGAGAIETSKTFGYDAKGNVTQVIEAIKDGQTGAYRVQWVTRYSDYDASKNVSSLWTLYPLLPTVVLQANNPGAIATYVAGPDGAEKLLQRVSYSYSYDEQGRPVTHTQTGPGGTLRAAYSYFGQ
ncbi:hypothetical protein [Spirosoma validum]|uniref:YD repeat-containing protein n=1 Tax=Spirosoma validum TaxID=2771355 RepID=A0A927B8K1_9BACT|nr:hypothetical protein [Spirosoma validum]MBD2757172.1 hypothetical protein [Spirosoma validum]